MRLILPAGLLLLAAFSVSACMQNAPDRIFVNGVVWTGDEAGSFAEAFAVDDSTFSIIGSNKDVRAAAGSNTEVVDLGGAFVVPGLIDNHTHFLTGGFQLASVDLRSADSPEEFARRIGAFAETLPAGRWILGGDWDHEAWGGRLPERDWIDAVTPDNPVFVNRLDGHMAIANSRAMDLAGITAETETPEGGEIVRYASGRPTGVLKDDAMDLMYAVIPDPSEKELDEALERAAEHALSNGVTQIHDVGSYGGWTDLATFQRAKAANRLPLRVYSLVPLSTYERLDEYVVANGRGDEWLHWGALKGFVDGSLGSTTAWFYEPYADAPGTSGILINDTTAIRQDIIAADGRGLHVAVHAIGDRANDWLLGVYADVEAMHGPRDRRYRIEHAQHLSTAAIPRFAELGVVPSMQPYHAIDDGRWAEKRIGPERIKTTYAFKSLLDAGANLTFGSDWTVAPIDPIEGIYAAVTRRTIDGANPGGWVPEQKITVEEALRAYTSNSAWAGFAEAYSGSIEQGKGADFVVLSENLFDIDPVAIADVRVLRTVVGGVDRFRGE